MPRRLRRVKRIRIETDRGANPNVFDEVHETWADAGEITDAHGETLPTCAHGCVIHSSAEIGGFCHLCKRLLCTQCARLRCEVCHRLACRDDADVDAGRVICKSHNLLRRVGFFLLPPARPDGS